MNGPAKVTLIRREFTVGVKHFIKRFADACHEREDCDYIFFTSVPTTIKQLKDKEKQAKILNESDELKSFWDSPNCLFSFREKQGFRIYSLLPFIISMPIELIGRF